MVCLGALLRWGARSNVTVVGQVRSKNVCPLRFGKTKRERIKHARTRSSSCLAPVFSDLETSGELPRSVALDSSLRGQTRLYGCVVSERGRLFLEPLTSEGRVPTRQIFGSLLSPRPKMLLPGNRVSEKGSLQGQTYVPPLLLKTTRKLEAPNIEVESRPKA